eukprot:TRINITY_DN18802_c0_g1_i1.p1 TRINITY_DN18802_c0_g1~~TRINITY_DN18802_c0_g1_i1.p1  ORF type:complete len:613 (+),score=96.57 TRINITY_DN18802_c0_g1_i1:103-1941(+)
MGNYCTCVAVEPSDHGQELLGSSLTEPETFSDLPTPRSNGQRAPEPCVRPEQIEHIDEVYQLDNGREGILGSSSIGTVVRTRHKKSQAVRAVKQISKRNIEGDGWKGEIQTIQQMDHPNICKLHETWEDSRHVYLIMELCRGGSLMNLSQRHEKVNESVIAALVWQMASAVGHLHKHNVVHSDIRPENWLFGELTQEQDRRKAALDTNLKMIDYGLANKHGKMSLKRRSFRTLDAAQTMAMSSHHLRNGMANRRLNLREQQSLFCKAPEQLDLDMNGSSSASLTIRDERERERAQKSDVWALGVLAYFLLSGQSPFHGTAETKDVQVRNARFVFMPPELWRPVSSEAKNFIALCLSRDPHTRPTARGALMLPWMQLARGVIEEHELRKMGRKLPNAGGSSSRLSILDPPLPSTEMILCSFDHMNQLNVLEKAGVIAAAHHLPNEKIPDLTKKFETMDKQREGLLSVQELFEALLSFGVPCDDLLKQVRDLDNEGCVAIEYSEFISAVDDYQRNIQDCAVWAVFRSFDTAEGGDGVRKKDLCKMLGQENLRKCLTDNFPTLALERVLQDMSKDGDRVIDFDQFTQVLRGSPPLGPNGYNSSPSAQNGYNSSYR